MCGTKSDHGSVPRISNSGAAYHKKTFIIRDTMFLLLLNCSTQSTKGKEVSKKEGGGEDAYVAAENG